MKPANENINTLPIKDFAKKIICDGHLYLRSQTGRRFYMMKPGIMIDETFIKKHAALQTVFDFELVTDQKVIDQFSKLFHELKYLQFERDLRLKTIEIVAFFKTSYENKNHFLSFALACYQQFNTLSADDLKRLHETDLHLFRKSLYSAAFAVIIGLTNDFYHYPMLKDFYNLSFGQDIGLCEAHYSYFVAEACNQENKIPGSGLRWMKGEGASESELNVFLKHPEKSHAFFDSHKHILAYPELIEIVLYQHELSDGHGFPRGIPKGQVSSWEAIVMLASSLVDISDEYAFEQDVINYLFSFQNQKLKDLPVQRVYQKLCLGLGDIFKLKESVG